MELFLVQCYCLVVDRLKEGASYYYFFCPTFVLTRFLSLFFSQLLLFSRQTRHWWSLVLGRLGGQARHQRLLSREMALTLLRICEMSRYLPFGNA